MLHSHHDRFESIDDMRLFAKSVKRGRSHSTVWTTGVSDIVTGAFVNGCDNSVTLGTSRSGNCYVRVGNVWIRDADAYLCTPMQCLELAGALDRYELKGSPGATADSMIRAIVGGVNWSECLDDESYDALRTGVPHGFAYHRTGKAVFKGASRESAANAMCATMQARYTLEKPIYEIDMNGAYRWAMANVRLAMPQFGYKDSAPTIDCDGMSLVSVSNDALRLNTGREHSRNGWAWNRQLRTARDAGAKIEVHRTVSPKYTAPFLAGFVSEIERVMRSSPELKTPLKLICNNAFGIMFRERQSVSIVRKGSDVKNVTGVIVGGRSFDLVQSESRQSLTSNPFASAEISAAVTERLISQISHVRRSGAVILASDTDSIVYSGGHPESIGVSLSSEAGSFKLECGPCDSVIIPAAKQRVMFANDGSVAKCVLAGVHRECFAELIDTGYAHTSRTPSIIECARFGRKPSEMWHYHYTLTDDGVSVTINNLDRGETKNGRRDGIRS